MTRARRTDAHARLDRSPPRRARVAGHAGAIPPPPSASWRTLAARSPPGLGPDMRGTEAKCSQGMARRGMHIDERLPGPRTPAESERAHLEEAHHELCTALTSVRTNVVLARIMLQADASAMDRDVRITAHLGEVDTAVERLERLAKDLRAWHALSRSHEVGETVAEIFPDAEKGFGPKGTSPATP